MAGTIKTNIVQLGDDPIATRNLVIRTNVDGTFTIARGNAGATTQDILTIDAAGRVKTLPSVVAFRAVPSSAQAMPAGTAAKILYQTEQYDYGGYYDASTSTFKPLVPGLYLVACSIQPLTGLGGATIYIRKNTATYQFGTFAASPTGNPVLLAVGYVTMNGTTDVVDVGGTTSDAVSLGGNPEAHYFSAALIAPL